uniref:Uncharacterized protein n=1 Tax=viral metagenome TaxID=1070528 RepID=A0A6H1ZRJ9_9ZZZZ
MTNYKIPNIAHDPAWQPVEPFDIECFYPGAHRGSDWSDEMNRQMCENYNNLPANITWRAQSSILDPDDAPFGEIDIGHDIRKLKDRQRPSIGVIDRMKYVGGRVLATIKNMPRFVKDCYDKGVYPNVSLTIYRDGQNEFGMSGPVPRGLSLLGAEPQQLKGLRRVLDLMSEQGQDITTIPGITYADAQSGANPDTDKGYDVITFSTSMKGQEMPEEMAPEVEEMAPEETAAPDPMAEIAQLRAEFEELKALIESALSEEEEVASEEGPAEPQGEFAEFCLAKFAEIDHRTTQANRNSMIEGKISELKGKGLAVDEPKIRKYAPKITDADALMAFCEACSRKVSVAGAEKLTYSEAGSGAGKTVMDIVTEMFSEHPNDAIEHVDFYARKYNVPRETLLK